MRYEITFIIVQLIVPVRQSGEVHLFLQSKSWLQLFIELPDIIMFDGENDKAVFVVFEYRFCLRICTLMFLV